MGNIRILIVDDNPHFVDQICSFLSEHADLDIVGTAASGEEAIQFIKTAECDLIVMDVTMPGMGGFETVQQLRSEDCQCGIILTSTNCDPYYRAAAKDAGADGFICKGDWTSEGVEMIRRITLTRGPAPTRNIF